MNRIMDAVKAHPSVLAGLLAAALLAGVAVALSTQPLVPSGGGAGSTGSMGSHSPAAMGSAEADDGAMSEPDEAPESAEGEEPAKGDPTASNKQSPAAEGDEVASGDPGNQQASSQAATKPSQGASKPSAPKPSPKPGAPKPPAPKPSHQHSWAAVYRTEPVYGQQWVSKWEDVYTRHERWACGCGQTFDNWNSCTTHRAAMAEAGNPCGRVVDDSYTTVEKVDRGSYQTVQTGTEQVLDHYECSCGATK